MLFYSSPLSKVVQDDAVSNVFIIHDESIESLILVETS